MFTDQTIVERLEALERQNHRMKQIVSIVLVIMASVLLMGQATGKRTVAANEFTLLDSKGKLRAVWGIVENAPQITFFNETNGRADVSLSLGEDGTPSLWLGNGEETIDIDIPTALELGPQNRYVSSHHPVRAEIEFKFGKQTHLLLFDQAPIRGSGEATALQMFTNSESSQSSTASIALFGKGANIVKPRVLWAAP